MQLLFFVEYIGRNELFALAATFPVVRAPKVLALFGASSAFKDLPFDAAEALDGQPTTFSAGVPVDMSRHLADHYYYPALASHYGVRCQGHMGVAAFEDFLEHVEDPAPCLRVVRGALRGATEEERARVVWWIEKT
jgi:hypothetical protein